MNLFKKIKQRFVVKRYHRKSKRVIKEANKMAELTGRKHYVLNVGGQLLIYTSIELRKLIRMRTFKKGTTMETLRKTAIHITK